jgi:hypothetical protein
VAVVNAFIADPLNEFNHDEIQANLLSWIFIIGQQMPADAGGTSANLTTA